jgi:hypothetical protein
VNIKSICNNDQIALAIVGLLRNISELFSAQEEIPYDLINQCVDIMIKYRGPFNRFHQYSEPMFDHIVTICTNFFAVLNKEGGAPHQTHFDLWFKIMTLV